MTAWDDLLNKKLVIAWDKQFYFAAFLENQFGQFFGFKIDAKRHVITFSERKPFLAKTVDFEFMCPGTILPGNKFVWAWHNAQIGMPPVINGEIANEILADASEHGMDELTKPILNFSSPEQCESFLMTLLAWAGDNACGFYKAALRDTGLVTLLKPGVFDHKVSNPIDRIKIVFPLVLENNPMIPSPQLAFRHYLDFYELEATETGNQVIAKHNDKYLVATFDENYKLVQLN